MAGYGVNATFNNISVISWPSVLLVEETNGQSTQIQVTKPHTALSNTFYKLQLLAGLN